MTGTRYVVTSQTFDQVFVGYQNNGASVAGTLIFDTNGQLTSSGATIGVPVAGGFVKIEQSDVPIAWSVTGTAQVPSNGLAQIILANGGVFEIKSATGGAGSISQAEGSSLSLVLGAVSGTAAVAPGNLQSVSAIDTQGVVTALAFNHTATDYTFGTDVTVARGKSTSVNISALAGSTIFTGSVSGASAGTLSVATGATLQLSDSASGGVINGLAASVAGNLVFNYAGSVTTDLSVSGTGSVQKTGEGTLTFSKLPQTNVTVAEGTLGFQVQSVSGGTTYAMNLSGAGAFSVSGGGLLILTGDMGLTGGTTVSNGTLQVGSVTDAATFSGAVSVAPNATFRLTNVSGNTFAGNVSGAGVLGVDTSGTISLTGTNTFEGGIIVRAGTLNVASANALPAGGDVNLEAGATLQLSVPSLTVGSLSGGGNVALGGGALTVAASSPTTYAGSMSGGSLTVSGAGPLSVTGASTLSAVTITPTGVLALQDGSSLGVGVTNNGALIFNFGQDTFYSRHIAGSGELEMTGSGTVTLAAANSLASVLVTDGTLVASVSGALGTGAGIEISAGATLQLGASSSAAAFANSGTLNLGGHTLTLGLDNALANITGTVESGGVITKSGTGSLVFDGADIGAVSINVSGGTVSIENASTFSNGASFDLAAGTGMTLSSSAAFGTLTGAGSVSNAGYLLTLTGAGGIFSGAISGTGGVTLAGTGTATFSGTNTYTGPTTVSSGTLLLSGGSAIADSIAVTLAEGATLQLGANEAVGSLAGAGAVALGAHILTVGSNGASTSFSGVISGGGLEKTGAGTLTLTGTADLAAGGLLISAGAVQIGSGATAGSIQGDIVDNGALIVSATGTTTVGGTISGTGSVTASGGGTVILTADNNYAGGTTISGAVLQLGAGGTSGAIGGNVAFTAPGSELWFNRSGTLAFAGGISGSGTVVINSGDVSLSGANSYSGGTFVYGSTLQVSQDANLGVVPSVGQSQGAVSLSNGTLVANGSFASARGVFLLEGTNTVSVAGGEALTLAGAIASNATSTLVKDGVGTLVLSGSNRYSGTTQVAQGVLSVSADANLGAPANGLILNGGTLAATASFTSARGIALGSSGGAIAVSSGQSLTLSGGFSGPGALSLSGGGTLALTGTSSSSAVSGGLSVNSGTLALYGGTLSAGGVTVASGARLTGYGTLGSSVTVAAGATLQGGITSADNPTRAGLSTGALTLAAGSSSILTLGTLANSGVAHVSGDLNAAGTLTVAGEPVHGAGYYRAFTYSGSLINALSLGAIPAGYVASIDTANAGQVNVLLRDVSPFQIWTADGGGSFGGSGVWSSTSVTWYEAAAGVTIPWGGEVGIFTGTAGAVTVSGRQTFEKLEFVSSGYSLSADAGRADSALAFSGGGTLWVEGHDVTATVSAPVAGTGGLQKIGAGRLILTGNNTYSGGTTISGGVLEVGADAALGSSDGGVTLQSGTLAVTSSFSTARAVALSTRGTFEVAEGQTLTLYGAVSGDGTLRKEGSGTLTLAAPNSYGGATQITAGTLLATGGNALPDGTAVTIEAAGRLVLGASETIGALSGAGEVNLQANTLTLVGGATSEFGGTILGSGALSLNGGGTLIVTGANSYSGGTSITGSMLMVGNGGTRGAIRGNVANAGTLAFFRSDVVQFDGAISGSGQVVQLGSGTLILTGTNTYSGMTQVAAGGTVQVSADANLGATAAELMLEGGTLSVTGTFATGREILLSSSGVIDVAAGSALTARGTVSGETLVKSGAGTLVIGGDAVISGSTRIEAGRLQVGEGGSAGSLSGDVINRGVLAFDLSIDRAFAGNVSGSGTLIQAGSGTLALTGAVSLTGGARIENGALQIGAFGTSGSLSGPVANDGILVFARSDATTFESVISGSGAVLQLSGTVTLSGTNSYSGGTYVGAGSTLRVSRDDNLGAATGALALVGGTLEVTQSFTSARAISLDGGGTLAVEGSRTLTLASAVQGSGGLAKSGTGTLILAADSSYSGGTTISGGTLQVGAGGTSGSITGTVSNAGTLRFERADTLTFAGSISGSGDLVQAGTGTLVLTGANAPGGGTLVASGTLVVGDGATSGSLSGDVRNKGSLVFDRSDAVTFGGAISDGGAVIQRGGGTLTLTAANSFMGGLTVEGGSTVAVASDSNLGGSASDVVLAGGTLLASASFASGREIVSSAGTLAAASGSTLTWTGVISGEGGLTIQGPGTVVLSAANSYIGGTSIAGATLSVGADTALGDAGGALRFNSGSLVATHSFTSARDVAVGSAGAEINVSGTETLALSGAISGTGTLYKGGTGILALTGANSYGGGLVIAEGGVIGSTRSIIGDVRNNGTLTFDQASDGRYAGSISGTGSLTKSGEGRLIVTGLIAPGGGTTISAGTLQVGNGGLEGWVSGAIRNEASLVYDLSGRYTFPELLTGRGGVTLMGGGTALFAGSSYGGTITLAGANLLLSPGVATSASVVIGANSLLSGTGTIGALTVNGGGTVSPGYSPGTLAVAGAVAFQGGTYRAEVQADGQHDLIAAQGSASIASGSTVSVVGSRGSYANSWTFNILTAQGGVTGAFASATTNFAFLDALLTYGSTYVDMTLVRNSVPFAAEARTPNERSTAWGTDTLSLGNPVYDAVASQLVGEAFAAFDALSGEIYASTGTVMQQQSVYVRDAIGGRLRQTFGGAPALASDAGGPVTAELAPGWTPVLWAQAFGGWGNSFSNGNAATISSSIGGVLGGVDVAVGDAWRVGAYGGFSQSWFNVSDRLSSGSMDNYDLGLYAGGRYGAWSVQLGGGYSWHDIGTSRTVSFPGYLGTNSADYTATLGQVFGEVGYEVKTAGIVLQPFAGLAYVHLDGGSGTESGSSSALTFSADTMETVYSSLGLRAGATLDLAGRPLTSNFTLGWRHAFGDTTPETQMAYASGSASFPIWGVPIAPDAAILGASLAYAFAPQALLSVRYDGQIAAAAAENAVTGQIQIRF
ncbi:MAG: autotransporter-associated beta strand repeat-containing protein [Pseudomonadota bacterium]